MKTRSKIPSTSLTRSTGTMLTAEQFRRLADVPAALEWLANIPNARTRRNYATAMQLLGFDHTRLTYYYNGLNRRLTDVHGRVITPILA